jgi:hypothetical protein
MELVDALRGKRICIDTAPFIYFIEKDPKYLNIVRPIFSEGKTFFESLIA